MSELSPEKIDDPKGKELKTLDVAIFFREQLLNLEKKGYSKEECGEFLEWHQPNELVKKIMDPDRFFRIIRDTEGHVIAYFESRSKGEKEIVQWIFVDQKFQNQKLGGKLWEEFFQYCKEKNIREVKSFCKVGNTTSINMHRSLGFKPRERDEEDGTNIVWMKKLLEK